MLAFALLPVGCLWGACGAVTVATLNPFKCQTFTGFLTDAAVYSCRVGGRLRGPHVVFHSAMLHAADLMPHTQPAEVRLINVYWVISIVNLGAICP
jgi:hypothetical protein